MPPTLSSSSSPSNASRLSFGVRCLLLAVPVGIGLGFGCGGGKGQTSSGFGGTASSASTSSEGSMTTGPGTGGSIFNTTTNGTGAGSTTGTGGGNIVCDPGQPTTGPSKFAAQGTDSGTQNVLGVAVDASGDVLAAGSVGKNAITVGGTMLVGTGTNITNAFVIKLGPDGAPTWGQSFVTSGTSPNGIIDSTARTVAADSQGNVWVGGDFNGTLTFGSFSITSAGTSHFFGDAFVAELDPTGKNAKALLRFGDTLATTPSNGGGSQQVRSLAVHAGGTGDLVAVFGQFESQLDLTAQPGGTVLNANTNSDAQQTVFLAVMRAADDSVIFETKFGDGTVIQNGLGVAFDKNGDVLVTGDTQGAITFPGGTTLTPMGTQAAFVAKIKGDGSTTEWAKLYGDMTASGAGVASDANGDVFVAGQHTGNIDFGGGPITTVGGSNAFVAKLDTDGTYVWAHSFGDSAAQAATGIAVDATGHATVTGEFTGKINFGASTLTGNPNFEDIFVAKLDTHGCQFWAQGFGDVGDHASNGVAVDAMGNAVVGGHMSGTPSMATTLTFGSTTLTSMAGDENLFVAKFGP